jgi:hydroxymethylglutaryl-CoA synthase
MVGITSYGAYIPRYRMDRKTIFGAMGWFNAATAGLARGEKAVANYDEDSITMAVAAASDCLNGLPRNGIGGMYLCSTTAPYLERQNAAICGTALALRPDIRSADFTGSLKSGTTALLAACDAVRSGEITQFLVSAADSRQGKPGGGLEHTLGDGAAALLVGSEHVIAELKGSYSVSRDFPDYRRIQGERFLHAWEERWIRDAGYDRILPELVAGTVAKYGCATKDFDKLVIACPAPRALQGMPKKLGVAPERFQDNLMNAVGDTGSALSLMMLVAALEQAKPGDHILLVSYGNGGDALWFQVTDEIEKRRGVSGIQGHLGQKRNLESYPKYLVFRNLLPVDVGIRGEEMPMARISVTYREGQTLSALQGSRCTACGTPQYPEQRVCINPECGVIDQMEPYYFYDKIGRINSYTGDNLAFSWDPPAMYGLIDFEEGGRLYLDITDCDLGDLKVGKPVKMSFRRKFADERRGMYSYFWKAVPLSEGTR